MRSRFEPSSRPASWTLLALAPLLVALACGAEEEAPASAEPEPETPAAPSPEPPPESPTAAEFPGCPGSSECLNGCRTRCETEHGAMLDLAALRACAERGDGAECSVEATNDPARQCFLRCRGLDPENFPLRAGAGS